MTGVQTCALPISPKPQNPTLLKNIHNKLLCLFVIITFLEKTAPLYQTISTFPFHASDEPSPFPSPEASGSSSFLGSPLSLLLFAGGLAFSVFEALASEEEGLA